MALKCSMADVPGINGYYSGDIKISVEPDYYVKIGDEILTNEPNEVRLFLRAYQLGREHKKTEIRTALGI